MIRYDFPMRKALAISSREKKGQEVSCLFLSVKCFNLFHQGFAVMKAIGLFLLTAFVQRNAKRLPRHLTKCNRNCDENSKV